MKSAIILALTSSAVAVPFGNVIDAIFGTANEARHVPPPGQMPSFHPIGTGSGTGFAFPTATGFPFPTGTGAFPHASGGMHTLPHGPGSLPGHRHRLKRLAIDYQLAPTIVPKIGKVEKRQAESGSSLPSFTLLDPSDGVPGVPEPTSTDGPALPFPTEEPESPFPFPTATGEPSFPFPTEDPESPFPTGAPEPPFPFPTATDQPGFPFPTGGFPSPTGGFPGGFPGTGFPSLPTTLATVTRGPQPTTVPELPGLPGDDEDGETGSGDLQSWLDWLAGLFGGGSGDGRSEMQN